MKPTKYNFSNGQPKGAFIYSVKNNGALYAKPTWYQFAGAEKNAQDIIARLEELNPGKIFVAA